MQPLTIEPGVSLGSFVLGSSINSVLSQLKRESMLLRDCRLVFDQADPLQHSITLCLMDVSIRLRFSPHTQRLILIDAYSPASLSFRYQHSSFPSASASSSPPSLSSIYAVFGPTYPPAWDGSKQAYLLQYPGICFAFGSPDSSVESPIETDWDVMDDGQALSLCRLFVHYGAQVDAAPPASITTASVNSGSVVQLHVGRGIWLSSLQLWLTFSSSVQDLLLDLGRPDAITRKVDEKMRIHAVSAAASPPCSELYFFNYFSLGLDLLIDGSRGGQVSKIVLHTNCVGSSDFGLYNKCDFLLLLPAAGAGGQHGRAGGGAADAEVPVVGVGCNARWDEVNAVLREGGCEVSRGMLNGGGEKGSTPFGSTMYFATRGLLFEVMKTGYLQTVTLFQHTS